VPKVPKIEKQKLKKQGVLFNTPSESIAYLRGAGEKQF
jgi:hypothetical protein